MKDRSILYSEAHSLQLNVFLLFYVYIFVVLVVANLLPVLPVTYFIFLAFGITGIYILLAKLKYHILIKKNTVVLLITIPFKILLLKLKIKEIEAIEEITTDPPAYHGYGIKKLKPNFKTYLFNPGNCIKLTMHSGKIFIISCADANGIIKSINAVKEQGKG